MRRRSPTHIYVAGLQTGGAVKVGITRNPAARLKGLHYGWPGQPMALFFAQELPYPPGVECRALRILADHCIAGEWFSVTPEAAIAAVKVAIRQEEEDGRPKPRRMISPPGRSAMAEITAGMKQTLADGRQRNSTDARRRFAENPPAGC